MRICDNDSASLATGSIPSRQCHFDRCALRRAAGRICHETRLLPDGLPADGIFGLAFVVLFAYTAVAGTAYLLKFKFTKAAACLGAAGALWGLYAATYEAGYDIIGCKPRYKTASDIDWQYVRQQVARQLNARKHPRPLSITPESWEQMRLRLKCLR